MRKRILSLIIILSLILPFICTIHSYAVDYDVTFSLNNINAKRGNTITVVVNMDCINSFSAGNFVLNYNSSVLEYVPYMDADNEIDFNQNCGETILNSFLIRLDFYKEDFHY